MVAQSISVTYTSMLPCAHASNSRYTCACHAREATRGIWPALFLALPRRNSRSPEASQILHTDNSSNLAHLRGAVYHALCDGSCADQPRLIKHAPFVLAISGAPRRNAGPGHAVHCCVEVNLARDKGPIPLEEDYILRRDPLVKSSRSVADKHL